MYGAVLSGPLLALGAPSSAPSGAAAFAQAGCDVIA
jgi:hypothetical protein